MGASRSGPLRAVVFDLGGVVFPGPFTAFDTYNTKAGLPDGFVRGLIRVSSETGAWAAFERGELRPSEFHAALEAEAADLGHAIDAAAVLAEIATGFGARPEMLEAIGRLRAGGFATAALTNNWAADPPTDGVAGAPADGAGVDTTGGLRDGNWFDVVVESSVVGLRKPDPRIYELVLHELGVEAHETVFLDDLGINLKPARAMGMTTIKVVDPHDALRELERHVGLPLVGA